MSNRPAAALLVPLIILALDMVAARLAAQSGALPVRVMAANLTSGNYQSYEAPGIRILQGLKPDIVALQEFRYNASTNDAAVRTLVDTAFGTNFYFFKEYAAGYNIPNGIVSRWPIVEAGSWDDPLIGDRGFAWAHIALPGSNDLYMVSMHLYSGGTPTDRNTEATLIKSNLLATFPTNAWVVVAGDCNTGSRTEAAITTFKSFLSDDPVPTDSAVGGNPDTNEPRSKPYDYLFPSLPLRSFQTSVAFPSQTYANGLVFDSSVFATNASLDDIPPVTAGDSHAAGMQHMGIVKDFLLPLNQTNAPPVILAAPQDRTNTVGTLALFTVTASGDIPLAYQWRFNGTNLTGSTTDTCARTNVQPGDAGAYSVIITNDAGAVTSAPAVLTVTIPSTNTFTNLLAGWDFSGLSGYGPSPLAPTATADHLMVAGLTRGFGVTTQSTAAARTWGGNGFDAADANAAIIAGDVATFALAAATGYRVSFSAVSQLDYKRSNSGPPNGVLQFQIGNGAFIDITNLAYTSTDGASLAPIDLSAIPALQNVGAGTNVTFRFVNYGAGSLGGNWYLFDLANNPTPDLVIAGTVAPLNGTTNPPPAAPVLSRPARIGNQIVFQLTGTTGSNYIIQSSTNLASGWLPLQTNAAPFWITNPLQAPQQFFRGQAR
ncbi:MAG TPA: hypothetical protein VFV96_04610 [Verrucomicrobiae bacterium]|nr:hypothetical protein [Verrucomicrobiae bacterium]